MTNDNQPKLNAHEVCGKMQIPLTPAVLAAFEMWSKWVLDELKKSPRPPFKPSPEHLEQVKEFCRQWKEQNSPPTFDTSQEGTGEQDA